DHGLSLCFAIVMTAYPDTNFLPALRSDSFILPCRDERADSDADSDADSAAEGLRREATQAALVGPSTAARSSAAPYRAGLDGRVAPWVARVHARGPV